MMYGKWKMMQIKSINGQWRIANDKWWLTNGMTENRKIACKYDNESNVPNALQSNPIQLVRFNATKMLACVTSTYIQALVTPVRWMINAQPDWN